MFFWMMATSTIYHKIVKKPLVSQCCVGIYFKETILIHMESLEGFVTTQVLVSPKYFRLNSSLVWIPSLTTNCCNTLLVPIVLSLYDASLSFNQVHFILEVPSHVIRFHDLS
jgi:hypothetical protein